MCASRQLCVQLKDGLILIRGVIHYDDNLRLVCVCDENEMHRRVWHSFTRSLRTVCMLSLDAGIVSRGTPENGVPKVILTVGTAFLGTQ